jgi:2-isopropylmalate synthase
MPNKHGVQIFDTTLRDGSQGEDISFSVEDKLAIAEKLDDFGVHYIEGGFPAAGNEKDIVFFQRARKLKFRNARLVAFGSTRRSKFKPGQDPSLKGLLEAETPTVCLFGKSWDLHATEVLGISLEENVGLIADSVAFIKRRGRELVYDAEHFFDGYKSNPSYALDTLKAAADAGADSLVLCDTNGGCTPEDITHILREVMARFPGKLIGIHAHNDGELAVANSLAAVRQGVRQVQGTINGLGERCGNANLISVIANLKFKLGLDSIPEKSLSRLTEVSRFVANVANLVPNDHQPFVGQSAFAHKSGVHSHAVAKTPVSYEHVAPELVGNTRRILISEQAGISSVISKARQFGFELDKGSAKTKNIIGLVKKLESEGYQFEGADASFALLLRRNLASHTPSFLVEGYRVAVEEWKEAEPESVGFVKVLVKGERRLAQAVGNGPVNALDKALREALAGYYPSLAKTHLIDFKVRVLQGKDGTASKVRVLMETTDGVDTWNTVGVHPNIIQASCEAMADSFEYKLLKDAGKAKAPARPKHSAHGPGDAVVDSTLEYWNHLMLSILRRPRKEMVTILRNGPEFKALELGIFAVRHQKAEEAESLKVSRELSNKLRDLKKIVR